MNSTHAIPTHRYDTPAQHLAGVVENIALAQERGRRPVLLCAGYAEQLAWQRALANGNHGFGVAVSTLPAWIEELWMLLGTGSAIVSPLTRTFAMRQAAREHAWSKEPTKGTLRLLEQCAAEAMPYVTTEGCVLSPEELHVAETLVAYRALLHERNLIEASEACIMLAQNTSIGMYQPIVVNIAEDGITQAQLELLASTNAVSCLHTAAQPGEEERAGELQSVLSLLYRRQKDDARVQPQGHVRMALPTGPTAELPLIGQVIEEHAERGTVIVACADPARAFTALAPTLTATGHSCSFSGRTPLAETRMGQHLLNLAELFEERQANTLLAADYALNIFAGINIVPAFRSDQSRRGNRLIQPNDIIGSLAENTSESLRGVIASLEEGQVDEALDALSAYAERINAHGMGPASESPAVIERARQACHEASIWGISWQEAIRTLDGTSVPASRTTTEEPVANVRFMTLDECARLQAASADTVIICDLCAQTYPIREPENALRTLMATWKCARPADPLGAMRRRFALACSVARDTLVLERALNDGQAEELQPASVFEEFIDCYREDLAGDKDIVKNLRITESLVPYATVRGEETLVANATFDAPEATEELEAPTIGELEPSAHKLIVLCRPESCEGLNLSASQIESYLECPYQWFAKRRMKLARLEEGFTAAERGNFIHDTLEMFYRRFQDTIAPKVTAETLSDAQALMEQVFADTAEHHMNGRPGGGRYVPATEMERRTRDALLPKLKQFLEFETTFLPSFTPWKFECEYGPLSYAGCSLEGRIDRIDIDEQGRAVVIDYKSSLSDAYRLHESKEEKAEEATFSLPGKMQALIYAQAVRRQYGCEVIATIYLNPLKCEIQGAYDAHVIGLEELPFQRGADASSAQIPWLDIATFDDLLERGEELVGQRMDELAHGIVDANPTSKEACKYCPVGNCSKRLIPRSI